MKRGTLSSDVMRIPVILLTLSGLAACAQPRALQQAGPVPPPTSVSAPGESETTAPPLPVEVTPEMKQFFSPLPKVFASENNPVTEEKIALGRMLFFDKRLSKNHDISCNTCHRLGNYGVDGDPVSEGHRQQRGERNAPTVYNAGAHVAQFWDGRAADLEQQAKGPILNPIEMAMPDETYVLKVVNSIPAYVAAFKRAFAKSKPPVTYDNLARAIGAFERRLITPGRFDRYLQGEDDALTTVEKRGLAKFVGLGCTTCHNGPAVGGTSFQKLGLVKEWPNVRDEGRFKVTQDEADRYKFRVPSLLNIEKTGPYLHDGSVTDLGTMVRLMARHQLGRELNDTDVADLTAFLTALTGELPSDYIAQPELPPSTRKTPKPDPS